MQIAAIVAMALAGASPQTEPQSAIGLLSFGMRRGTGFLISECRAVTNKHVLPRRARVGARGNMLVAGKKRRITVEAIGDHPDPAAEGVERAGDWALLRLDECVGADIATFDLLAAPLLATPYFHDRVSTPDAEGFIGGRRPLSALGPCPTVAVLPDGTIEYACRARGGQSGSPIYVRKADGRLLAVAIVSAAVQSREGHTYAAPLEVVADLIRNREVTAIDPFRTHSSNMEETRSAFR